MDEQPRQLTAYGHKRIRRRKPKKNIFLKVLLAVTGVVLILTAVSAVVFWKYLALCQASSTDEYAQKLADDSGTEGWRQLLRQYFPASYPKYENGTDLAYKVLSPKFSVGNVTWLRVPEAENPTYMFFSDGTRFAVLTLTDTSDGKFGVGKWVISSLKFDLDYIKGVNFPTTEIICPENAVLSINGTEIKEGSLSTEKCGYPDLSRGEISGGPVCTSYKFNDIWFAPNVSCTLDGKTLELVADESNRYYYFKFPESLTHSITVTVPAGVKAFVGGQELTADWAEAKSKFGELGALDDGGTGTLPMLTEWTVKGLFDETTVTASVYEKEVKLLSSENHNYVFEIPAECRYNVVVIVPKGASVKINGKAVSDSAKTELSLEEIGQLGTIFGRYRVSELAAVPAAVPDFEKYAVSGYLALPTVSVSMAGAELKPCTQTVDAYDALWEYDWPLTDQMLINPARVTAAENFLSIYVKYVCDGGSIGNAGNAETFDKNYNNLLSKMMNGTSGYLSVMESYREVNKMPHYSSFTLSELATEDYIAYTDSCISCRITCRVLRTTEVKKADGTAENIGSTVNIGMNVLQVLYNGEWRIWGFEYTTN